MNPDFLFLNQAGAATFDNLPTNIQDIHERNKNFEWHFERFKVTGLIQNGQYIHAKRKMKLVRMVPLYFSTYEKAKTFFDETVHIGTLWTRNEEGARNTYSVTETRNMEWPEGARGL